MQICSHDSPWAGRMGEPFSIWRKAKKWLRREDDTWEHRNIFLESSSAKLGAFSEEWGATWVQLPQIKMGNEMLYPQLPEVCFFLGKDPHELTSRSVRGAKSPPKSCKINTILNIRHTQHNSRGANCLGLGSHTGKNLQKVTKPWMSEL